MFSFFVKLMTPVLDHDAEKMYMISEKKNAWNKRMFIFFLVAQKLVSDGNSNLL